MKSAEPTASPGQLCLDELFVRVVDRCANDVALIDDTEWLTYSELGERVASQRRTVDAAPEGRPIAVALPGAQRSADDSVVDAVARLLAVLVSGRTAVPLDGSLPPARRQYVVDRSGALLLGDDPALRAAPSPVAALDCAVLMFTSGSTGVPKAVRQGHRMWRHQVEELSADLDIGPGRRVLSALPVSFGGGLDIALTALFSGACLVLTDPRRDGVDGLWRALAAHPPHGLHLSPALLRAFTAQAAASGDSAGCDGLDLVCTCGEAPDASDVAALRAVLPAVTYINRAGSSETGNLAFNAFPPDRAVPPGTLIPGRLAATKSVVVHDVDDGRLLPAGSVGRLEVHSPFLADGYLADGRLVDFPCDDDGVRRHALGDAGSVVDGELRFAGRLDDALKIRGYLVDVSEVTAAVRSADGVADAVVVARRDPQPELVAYLQPFAGQRPPSTAQIRAHVASVLPPWMHPAHLVLIGELPRTERGKVDRTALPEPPRRPLHRAPATRTEKLLAPLWEDLLHVDDVGGADDFTALGGDSLTAVALLDRLEEAFSVRLPLAALSGAGTLTELAVAIDSHSAGGAPSGDVVELSSADSARSPILFAFAGAGEAAHAFTPLARRLPGFRVIGVQSHALDRRGLPDWTVGRAVRRALRQVRTASPSGPYRFVGHSLGGVVAMEVARRLTAVGETVEHIVCLDTVLDDGLRARSPIVFPPLRQAQGAGTRAETSQETSLTDHATPDRAAVWKTRLALLTAGWIQRPADVQWPLFHELGRRSALLHRLTPWDGPVTVVVAEENDDPLEWWPLVATDCRGVRRVPGDHTGMLRPPHVTATAQVVAGALAAHQDVSHTGAAQ
ncbi:MAG: alpha/beta fold hydrolase [Gordonia sp. (in: high G+C Gram-positive bacteria)]